MLCHERHRSTRIAQQAPSRRQTQRKTCRYDSSARILSSNTGTSACQVIAPLMRMFTSGTAGHSLVNGQLHALHNFYVTHATHKRSTRMMCLERSLMTRKGQQIECAIAHTPHLPANTAITGGLIALPSCLCPNCIRSRA